jgi:hypothetical protein
VIGAGVAVAQPRDASFGARGSPVTFGGWRSNAAERQAARYLEDARMVLGGGHALEGRRRLEILVARFPDTKAADEARAHLSRLYAEPARDTVRTTARPGGDIAPASSSVAADVRPGPQASITEARFAAAAEWDLRITAGDRVFFGDGSADLGSSARSVLGAQTTPLLHQLARELLHPDAIHNGDLRVKSAAAVSFDLGGHRLREIVTRIVTKSHVGSFARKNVANGRTDSPRSSGYERAFSLKQQTHLAFFLLVLDRFTQS